ncbi:Hydroxyacylglutathione hydrolase [Halomonadaceae bacterium LMG 33818]|uniref:hydroxyacylglutathione hydrolase n=1 Tax=Cernens ardua TaxID=3402176 RepID=UPI003EDC273B
MSNPVSVKASSLEVTALPALSDNYIWVITSPEKKDAIIVDPGESSPVVEWLEHGGGKDYTLTLILVTHHHGDHTGGVAELARRYHVPVWGPKECRSIEAQRGLSEGDSVELFGYPTEIWSTPGHTLDHIVYLVHTEPAMLFCGDTLFRAGSGRLFEGTPAQMLENFKRFQQLPEDTLVFGAHEYTVSNLKFAQQVEPENADIESALNQASEQRSKNQPTLPSTIKDELAVNPFMRFNAPSVIQALEARTGHEPADETDAFAKLRGWKDIA